MLRSIGKQSGESVESVLKKKRKATVRYNARNNARCTQARKATHGLDGQHQDVDRTPWKSLSE